MREAIQKLEILARAPRQANPAQEFSEVKTSRPDSSGVKAPVFLLAFTHHYNGPGGYYPSAKEVRSMGEFFIKAGIPGTLFFDGILVERLQKEDPALIRQVREWNLPLGYHGEETHGPYPVASELLGEVYTLPEARGYKGPWSLTTGRDWSTAVRLVEERYSHARPYRIDPNTRMIDRSAPVATDLSGTGGLKLVQQAFGKDVAMMTSHALESAPEGYAFRRMSQFGLDQPAVPVALHALKIFRISEVADRVMAIAGEKESIFWYMGRLHCKGDETGETHYRPARLRQKLDSLDRSRPRLLLVGFSKVDEAEGIKTAEFLRTEFVPKNPGSGWVTGHTLTNYFEPEKGWQPTASDQLAIARAVTTGWQGRPPDLITIPERICSLADAFESLARACAERMSSGILSGSIGLHSLYGPLSENGAPLLSRETRITVQAIQEAAQAIVKHTDWISGDRFIPAQIDCRGIRLNAGEFLYAMAAALQADPAGTVSVAPAKLFPPYADLLQSVFKPKAVQPVCYTSGQLWTVKPVRLKASEISSPSDSRPGLATSTPEVIRVVFASNLAGSGGCYRDDPSGADLWSVNYNLVTGVASSLRQLTSKTGPEWFPALSADGRFVVYDRTEANQDRRSQHNLWQIDLGSGREQLLLANARFPAFDPQGRFLYYSPQLRGVHQLRRASLRTAANGWLQLGESQILADETSGRELVEDPAPLPDNSAIVFHRKESESGAGLGLISTAGGTVHALTGFDGCGHAAVSPDGQAVACTRSRDGRIVIIRRDGPGWGEPQDLPVSSSPGDYEDARFKSVREVRHSYVEWVTPKVLLVTTHGAEGARAFKFSRIYCFILKQGNQSPTRLNLSEAIETLAGKSGKDFCSAAAQTIDTGK
jgi:hypothetical protein